jgi:hypothetical protein
MFICEKRVTMTEKTMLLSGMIVRRLFGSVKKAVSEDWRRCVERISTWPPKS